MRHRGFTLIEAVVSISLFSLMILGATLQLRAYEDGQRSIADALILVKTARTFLTELSQVSRQNDSFSTIASGSDGVVRPEPSVLDGFMGDAVYGDGTTRQGYDFYAASSNDAPLNADLAAFIDRWNTEDADNRTRLFRSIGRRADAWRIRILSDASAPGAYRLIELHLDIDDDETNLKWPICCEQ